MDKGKNRTDLIAAGRKKLQQFRQKKDPKGTSSSHGKSSQKASKSGSLAVQDASAPILGGTDVESADSRVISTVPDSAVEDVGQVVGPDVGSADSLLATEDAYVPISGGINVASADSDVVSTVLDSAFEDVRQVVGPDVGSINLPLAAKDASVPISGGTDVVSDDSGVVSTVPDSVVEDIGQVFGPDVGLTYPLLSSTVAILEEEEVVQRTGDDEEGQLEVEVMERGVGAGAVLTCKDKESALVAEDKAAFSGVENQIEGTVVEDVIQHVGANLSAPQEENYAPLATALLTENETGSWAMQEVDLSGSGNLDSTDEADRVAERDNKVMGQKGEAIHLSSNAGDREEEKRFSIPAETNGSTLNPIRDQPEVSNVCSDNRILPFSTEQVEGSGGNVEQDAEVVPEAFDKCVPSNAVFVASFVAENCDSMEKCDDISRVDPILSGVEEGSREQAVSPENFVCSRDIYETECNHGLDVLKRQLYVANVAKECLQMQLAEHADLQVVFEQHNEVLHGEVSKLCSLVKETQEINKNISGELAYFKSELNTLYLEKEEFRLQFLSGKEEIKELRAQCCQLLNKLKDSEDKVAYLLTANNELQMSHNSAEAESQEIKASAYDLNRKLEKSELEASDLSNVLAECRGLLSDLQIENANLTERCSLAVAEKEKLEKEKDDFAGENAKISTDSLEHKERVSNVLKSQAHLEAQLKEALTWNDSLSEENIYLSTLLEVHKCNLKELDRRHSKLFALQRSASCQLQTSDLLSEVAYKSGEEFPSSSRVDDIDHTCDLTREYTKTGGILDPSYNQRFGSFDKLASFKGHLEKGRKILEKLEKEVQLMQSHSDITNRPMNKTGASGVSKLIQAFESKVQQDEIGTEEGLLSEERFLIYSKLVRELISSLGNIFEQFSLDISETNKIIDDMSQRKNSMTAALRDLETEYESKCLRTDQLVARIGVMVHDMAKYQEKLDALQIQIDGLQLNCSDLTDSLFTQTDLLENVVNDTVSLLDQDREYLLSSIFCRIEKVNASMRLLVSPSSPGDLGANASSPSSVDAAVKMIESLCAAFEAAYTDSERIHLLYKELDERFMEADGKSREAIEMLDGMCKNLENLVHDFWPQDAEEIKEKSKKEKSLDVTPSKFEILINQLRVLLDARQHPDSLRKELESELMKRKDELTEVKQRCSLLSEKLDENESKKCDVGPIEKVVKIIQAEVQIEKGIIREDLPPLAQLENLIAFLLSRYKEAAEQIAKSVSFLKEVTAASDVPSDYWLGPLHFLLKQECDSNLMKLNELQEDVYRLSVIVLQKEDEAFMLKETMAKVGESLEVSRSELLAKTSELEQSDQKLSSVREKLSLAVAKGKGLIVQRDGLKQSLVEKSSELDKMLHDMQLKDENLRETENKLKIYSEAGERIEALESELSYIRNSATALRESFLLKDSVLQRIEEVLEDLELPETFHSKDVIEKIEWLARSASGTSLPLTDWNNHSSVEGSYSNSGYPGIKSWRENSQVASEQVGLDAIQNKYEELERKYYGLAEQNEMLEQSLLEQNSLVQRWEETLNKIEFPGELGSMEPEIQIEWLGKELIDAHHERDYWHLKVDELESSSGLLIAEVDESKKKLYDLNENFVAVSHEKYILSGKLDELAQMHETLLKKMTQLELDKDTMLNEVVLLQEKLSQSSNNYHLMVNEVKELSRMISDILPEHKKENVVYSNNVSDDLRLLLSALINSYTALSNEKPKDNIEDHEIQNPEVVTDKEVEVASVEVEQEKYSFKAELDVALNKLALITEEKSVIQDKYQSLVLEFATIRTEKDELQELFSQEEQKSASAREKLNIAVRKGKGLVQQRDTLKQSIEAMSAEIDRLKHELDQKNNDVFTISSKVVAMESDNSFLRNNLRQTEHEAEKLKKASELLLAELNEVHERADNLLDELEKAKGDVHELSRQKDSLEAVRIDMVSNLELFRKHQSSYLLEIKTFVEHLRKECFDLSDMLANSFSKDGEILDNVEAGMESFWKQIAGTQNFSFSHLPSSAPILEKKDGLSVTGSLLDLKMNDETGATDMYGAIADTICQCSTLIDQLKKKCLKHSTTIDQWAIVLPETLKCIYNELTLHKESFESTKKNLTHLKLLKEEKDSGMSLLYKCLALLYETCTCSVWRLEYQNVHDSDVRFKPLPSIDELGTTSGSSFTSLEELVRLTADSLLSAVNDRPELSQKDLKDAIMDLQEEIQDKDLQTNRICEELVTQIKEAEATARNYLAELESVKTHMEAMKKELEVMGTEKSFLESKLNQNHQAAKKELEEKIESLTDVIASKDQEIDALMQALDEERSQMETWSGKIDELEKTIQEKNLALECHDATRGKAMSKLSTTINRFNELHSLSEGLISEVETLQTQLEGKETEVSFLRQEVTKCTNEILTLQGSNKKYSSEVLKILTWLELMASDFGIQNMLVDEKDGSLIHDYMEILGKAITSVLSELNEFRLAAQSWDLLLQAERHKVEELAHTKEVLKTSIREKEAQLQMLQATHNSGQSSNVSSMETLEVDQVRSKRSVALGSIGPQVPSLRKVNDQVAVGIDLESGETVLEDEDDDKAHGFKPLVMSSFVPRATRPIADKVDGLWVSGERMLMRQPTLRIGVVVYWILLHAFLATTIV